VNAMTIPTVVEARFLRAHVVWLRFSDGAFGEVDLGRHLDGPVFQPLRDEAYFRLGRVHPELCTLTWPNGADFAPEYLRDNLRQTA